MTCLPLSGRVLAAVSLLGFSVLAAPYPAQAASGSCSLRAQGECCSVTISPGHDATINTAIDTAAQQDYVLILGDNQADCVFQYDGAFSTPMRLRVQGYKATWAGDAATLRYKADAANAGSCRLSIYYMSEGYDKFPPGCSNGKYTPALASYNKPPATSGK